MMSPSWIEPIVVVRCRATRRRSLQTEVAHDAAREGKDGERSDNGPSPERAEGELVPDVLNILHLRRELASHVPDDLPEPCASDLRRPNEKPGPGGTLESPGSKARR